MPSCPDSMRTLSSRLSISRVRRSVPRCSDVDQFLELFARQVVQVFLQQLDRRELRGQRRAEFVRDVGQDRIARAAHGFEFGLVTHDLHLQAVDHAARW